MSDNPGRVMTKFHSLSLRPVNPLTIISGFCKVGVCPFNATAIKPYTDVGDASDKIPLSSSGGFMMVVAFPIGRILMQLKM